MNVPGMTAFRAAAFTVAMRWSDRLLAVVSTMILARLLSPEDFGLVAMAMIVVGIIDVVLDLGVAAALVQSKDAGRREFETAWTLRLIQAGLAAVIVVFSAPLAASYFHDARVKDLMYVIALTVLIGGLENIGVVTYQKEMRFDKELRFFMTKRLVAVILTISLAFTWGSYWALVIGTLAGRSFGVVLSYLMHPFRPRLSLQKASQIWSFSQWNIILSIVSYVTSNLDRFVIGRRSDATVLGTYTVAGEIASVPSTELLAPLGRVMFPAFVQARDDVAEFRRIVQLSLSVQALVGIPAAVGMAVVAHEAVPLMLGDRWRAAVPYVQVLSVGSITWALASSAHYALLVLGRIKTLALYRMCFMFAYAAALVAMLARLDVLGIAEVRVVLGFCGLLVIQWLSSRALQGLGFVSLFRNTWRPVLASGAMGYLVLFAGSVAAGMPVWFVLLVKIGAGVIAYLAILAALWRLAGMPEGGERYLLSKSPIGILAGRRGGAN